MCQGMETFADYFLKAVRQGRGALSVVVNFHLAAGV